MYRQTTPTSRPFRLYDVKRARSASRTRLYSKVQSVVICISLVVLFLRKTSLLNRWLSIAFPEAGDARHIVHAVRPGLGNGNGDGEWHFQINALEHNIKHGRHLVPVEKQTKPLPRGSSNPRISLISLITRENQPYLPHWLTAISNNEIFEEAEWLVGISGHPSTATLGIIANSQSRYPNIYYIDLGGDALPADAWNVLIKDFARSSILAIAEIERVGELTQLKQSLMHLETQPAVDAVLTTWADTPNVPRPSIEWQGGNANDLRSTFQVQVSDLFEFDSEGRITGSSNYTQGLPIWRKSLHGIRGYFDASVEPLAAWDFWLRSVRAGSHLQIILEPTAAKSQGQRAATDLAVQKSVIERHHAAVSCRPLNILVTFERTLHLDEGADRRMLQLLKFLRSQGHQVHFPWRRTKGVHTGANNFDRYDKVVEDIRPTTRILDQWGITYTSADFNLSKTMDTIKAGRRYDIAIIPIWFWWGRETAPELLIPGLRQYSPNTKVVVVTDDIHHGRLGQTQTRCNAQCVNKIKNRETKAYSSADLVLTVTEEDAQQVRKLGGHLVESLPHTEDPPKLNSIPFQDRSGALFVGSGHGGNQRAVRFLVNEIVPLVRAQDPSFELHLVGSRYWNDYKKPGVVSHGHVKDPFPYLSKALVFVNPNMVLASGIATKNVLAMNHGLPLLTSEAGRAGLCLDDDCGAIHVASTAKSFAELMLKLTQDESAWKQAHDATLEHARKAFTLERLANMNGVFAGMMRSLGRTQCGVQTSVRGLDNTESSLLN